VTSSTVVVVAVDVGKTSVALSVTDTARSRLFGPVDFPMTRSGLADVQARVRRVLLGEVRVKVGAEAAGHYHRPLTAGSAWPPAWEVLELNPTHVSEQRRVAGRRRVKTDAIDLEAITELVFAGHGVLVFARDASFGELTGWARQTAPAPDRDPYGYQEPVARSTSTPGEN
jgi:transposase